MHHDGLGGVEGTAQPVDVLVMMERVAARPEDPHHLLARLVLQLVDDALAGVGEPVGVPLGAVVGLTRFPGKRLVTLVLYTGMGLPPVVVGLFLLLLFGLQGTFGPWLREHDIRIVFAYPGLVLATAFGGAWTVIVGALATQGDQGAKAATTSTTWPRMRWACAKR